jgi:hypothetical protein
MRDCEQFPGMSVLQHGQSVSEWFQDLIGKRERLWRLSKWADEVITHLDKSQLEAIRLYQIYHDCGKPYCREVDEQGRAHFPCHAEVSEKVWNEHSDGSENDRLVGRLIGMDMLAHTVKGEAIEEFVNLPEAPILILTALAEIHSNAAHLNALDSDSFKIKLKQVDKLGKRFLSARSSMVQSTCL